MSSSALTPTHQSPPSRSRAPGRLSSHRFQNATALSRSSSPNNSTTISSGKYCFFRKSFSFFHFWPTFFSLKFAQQANAVGPWIQQKTEEIVGVALEMDGTLEQQIQKLKIYQVTFRRKSWKYQTFRLLSRATDQRSRSSPTITRKSRKLLFSTIHTQTTLWNTFTLVWSTWELPSLVPSTKLRTR